MALDNPAAADRLIDRIPERYLSLEGYPHLGDGEIDPLGGRSHALLRERRRGSPGAHVHGNLHLLAKSLQHGDQALDRETVEIRTPDTGKIAVIDAGHLLGLAGAETGLIEHLEHLAGQDRLELTRLRVGTPKVTEYVAAAVDQFHVVVAPHRNGSFSRFSPSLTKSISCFGVAIPPFVGDLSGVLCSKHARSVGNDNCVHFRKLDLQIPEQRHRRHYVRAAVEVREYADGALSIFHGPRRLADYTADGVLITGEAQQSAA